MRSDPIITRRRFLVASAALTVAACSDGSSAASVVPPSDTPVSAGPAAGTPTPPEAAGPASSRLPEPTTTPAPAQGGPAGAATGKRRTLYRDGALVDGRSTAPRVGVSILVEDGTIRWIRPSDDEGPTGTRAGLEVVDASGSTIVPGMVDAHSHLTMPGGAHWIDRGQDAAQTLLAVAESNGRLLTNAGVRWARDVGAVRRVDPVDGRERALSLGVRDRWRKSGRRDYPHIRAAETWLTRRGSLPVGLTVEVDSADGLLAAALAQLEDGADLVKLYLDGPDPATSPWSAAEIRRVVAAVHDRGARVTAHSGRLSGARAGIAGGVDALEHGFELDADVATDMAKQGTFLVSTLAVFRSWLSFGRTTRIERFSSSSGVAAIRQRQEAAAASLVHARRAGVKIAAGTDFGGGSLRANQLAWEVESLVDAGLEPHEAIAAATWRGGELLGEPGAGMLRDGGPADLFLVHGDPLSDPAALWRVWRVDWTA
jgi:imidazolonepropionase-like amidohydrolase